MLGTTPWEFEAHAKLTGIPSSMPPVYIVVYPRVPLGVCRRYDIRLYVYWRPENQRQRNQRYSNFVPVAQTPA